MSILLELLLEFVIQLVLEVLVELGLHGFKRDRPAVPPVVSVVIYVLLGGGLGWLSLMLFPQQLISHPMAQMANLAITPVAVGLVLSVIGSWRSRRGGDLVRLDKFSYGYVFALAFALVRYAAA
ncbi:hypothetical protein [Lysobacter silvisoli]|uniref:Uncharacterized protein n=1 Tax=Lysobacter silvisoli TaxID=2293254 RepID=A0A371K5D0_9GAMM|nr:hypothetical protein [Lysobacter silvisoli]RDZ29139.1 hypothetical protein DX914_08615 [Lysobacter silvisoli]